MSDKKTVAIVYGIAEGPWHGKKFRRELIRAGYRVIDDSVQADIVIGHSAGCYFLPEIPTGQTIMLIDPPFWPGRSGWRRAARKVWLDGRYSLKPGNFFYFQRKNLWNIYYACRQWKRTRRVIQSSDYDVEAIIRTHQAIVIRNRDDAWLTPDLERLKRNDPAIVVHDLPGEHDDCWRHPEAYIAVLSSLE